MARAVFIGLVAVCLALGGGGSRLAAQDQAAAIEELKKEMRELRKAVQEKDRQLERLEKKLEAVQKEIPAPKKEVVATPTPPSKPEEALEKAVKEVKEKPTSTKEVVAAPPPPSKPEEALDQAVKAVEAKEKPTKEPLWSKKIGKAEVKLMDISADLLVASGTSTATDQQLQFLEGGGHDPKKRGFTLQQFELGFAGAVDPYFNAQAFLIWQIDPITNESIVEIEEAYFTTQKLPLKLQLKGGYYLTEFGIINPTHPHAWVFLDQPVINTRVFGPDGLRSAGARLTWLTPLPWYSMFYFGIQNANNLTSFQNSVDEGPEIGDIGFRPIINRPTAKLRDMLYFLRWENSFNVGSKITAKQGFSALYGPNSTGPFGETWIYGGDLKVKWQPAENIRGWPFLIWQSEIIKRDYLAASFSVPGNPDPENFIPNAFFPKTTLTDWGLYTYLYWGFRPGWAAGIRYEWASGTGNNLLVNADERLVEVISRNLDPFRGNRTRLSSLLAWYPSEFSRIRFQYNYDWASFLHPNNRHTFWLGFEVMFGAHPAHKF
jgi:uncharacterized coiled-coil protein SlyX